MRLREHCCWSTLHPHRFHTLNAPTATNMTGSSMMLRRIIPMILWRYHPKGFSKNGRVDFVVHFHGWKNHVEAVLRHYQLIEQLMASRRNAVLVIPQGPCDAPDSFGGKLEDPGGLGGLSRKFPRGCGKVRL